MTHFLTVAFPLVLYTKLFCRAESLPVALPRFCLFGFAVFRRCVRNKRFKQNFRCQSYLFNRRVKRFRIYRRRFIKPADFADKLNRRRPNFFIGRRRREIMQLFDVSAHKSNKNSLKTLVNGHFPFVNDESSPVNDESSLVNLQSIVVNDESSVVNGHCSPVNDRCSVVNDRYSVVITRFAVVKQYGFSLTSTVDVSGIPKTAPSSLTNIVQSIGQNTACFEKIFGFQRVEFKHSTDLFKGQFFFTKTFNCK